MMILSNRGTDMNSRKLTDKQHAVFIFSLLFYLELKIFERLIPVKLALLEQLIAKVENSVERQLSVVDEVVEDTKVEYIQNFLNSLSKID
jgi:hypothetical protein